MWAKYMQLLHRRDTINALAHSLQRYSQAARILITPKKEQAIEEVVEDRESLYPPIKPKYPPGQWGNISANSAWKIHEITHDVLKSPSAKWRLENLAGNNDTKLWLVSPLAPRPNNLPFQKIITRSHLIEGTPDVYKDDCLVEDNPIVEKCCELIQGIYEQEYNQLSRDEMELTDSQMKNFLSRVTKMIVGLLSSKNEHLRKGEIDEVVRVETFWRVGGFEGEEKSGEGAWEGLETTDGVDPGILQFQYRHQTDLQLRSELPLPEFISIDDPVCRVKEVTRPSYAPAAVNINVVNARPISVAGQWIGSACEFIPFSIHHLPSSLAHRFNNYGSSHLDQAEKVFLVSSMFASCLSQAYNQGFTDLLDLTYPITTQAILSTNSHVRFASYQLNTTMIWNNANTLQNIAWISPPTPLFTTNTHNLSTNGDDNNEAKKINPLFVRSLLNSLLLKTVDRAVNLRPYLPHDPSPLTLPPPINHIGTPPPEHYVPERWEYPKYAVYF